MTLKNLNKTQRQVLEKLVKSGITKGFYIAGGTALFIKYSHRVSEDLDFFSQEFNLKYLKNYLKNLNIDEIITEKEDTLIFFLQGVKCSFFLYPYKEIGKRDIVELKYGKIELASDEDITAMKAIAIIQRGSKKDFFDLWYLMKIHSLTLKEIKKLCWKKYGKFFSEVSFERAIVYFEDAEKEVYPFIDPYWEEIKLFFKEQIKNYCKSI